MPKLTVKKAAHDMDGCGAFDVTFFGQIGVLPKSHCGPSASPGEDRVERPGPYVWGSHFMRSRCLATPVRTASDRNETEQYSFLDCEFSV